MRFRYNTQMCTWWAERNMLKGFDETAEAGKSLCFHPPSPVAGPVTQGGFSELSLKHALRPSLQRCLFYSHKKGTALVVKILGHREACEPKEKPVNPTGLAISPHSITARLHPICPVISLYDCLYFIRKSLKYTSLITSLCLHCLEKVPMTHKPSKPVCLFFLLIIYSIQFSNPSQGLYESKLNLPSLVLPTKNSFQTGGWGEYVKKLLSL